MTWNRDKLRNMLQQVARWNNRLTLLHKNTRLNCPSGCGVRRVTDFKPLARVAVLDCSHERPVELDLPDADRRELITFLASPEGRIRKRVKGSQNSTKHFEVTYEVVDEVPEAHEYQ
jgi:hypothetical protein